jgi:spore maturation protein CgeB
MINTIPPINASVLFLTATDCKNHRLRKYGGIAGPIGTDFDSYFVQPLLDIFSKVIVYDSWGEYFDIGVVAVQQKIIDLVRKKHPQYLLWPSMAYEVLESTFQEIRKEGTTVVGWFFDDEVRFDNYSCWWSSCIDVFLTNDEQSVEKYFQCGRKAIFVPAGSNSHVFKKVNVPFQYDVSFIGRKFGNREQSITQLKSHGIKVEAFGNGWNKGFVPSGEIARLFNASKINLNFTSSYGNGRPQLKARFFEVCTAGGFLLSEYFPGVEEYFELDKEIVCFKELGEAVEKILYYLNNEEKRLAIAAAGYKRANQDHTQQKRILDAFCEIQKGTTIGCVANSMIPSFKDAPSVVRQLSFLSHLHWAKALRAEGYPQFWWRDELKIAIKYNSIAIEARIMLLFKNMPWKIVSIILKCIAFIGKPQAVLGTLRSKMFTLKDIFAV